MNDAQVVDTSVSPRDYEAAGVVPFNDDGFWLARTSSGYADVKMNGFDSMADVQRFAHGFTCCIA